MSEIVLGGVGDLLARVSPDQIMVAAYAEVRRKRGAGLTDEQIATGGHCKPATEGATRFLRGLGIPAIGAYRKGHHFTLIPMNTGRQGDDLVICGTWQQIVDQDRPLPEAHPMYVGTRDGIMTLVRQLYPDDPRDYGLYYLDETSRKIYE